MLAVGCARDATQVAPAEPPLTPDTVTISGAPTCNTCVIRVETVTVIAPDSGPGAIRDQPIVVLRDSRGQVYLHSDVVPQVFDGSGAFLRTIGRDGDGPGEFRQPAPMIVGPGDSLFVYDISHRRFSVIDPMGEYVRDYASPMGGAAFFGWKLPSGSMLVMGRLGGAAARGHGLHLIGGDGNLLRSFGGTPGGNPDEAERTVAIDSEGTVWSAHYRRRFMDQFDSAGTLVRSYNMPADWESPWDSTWKPAPDRPARTMTLRAGVDSAGLLWLVSTVPRADWARHVHPRKDGRPGYTYVRHASQQARIEVIDVDSQAVIVSKLMPFYITHMLGTGYASIYDETDAGIPRLTIVRLSLHRPN